MKNKDEVLKEIKVSKKYKDIKDEVIIRIIDECYGNVKNNKLLIKEVKNKLHQIHEIFLNSSNNIKAKELVKIGESDEILKLHMSTLERLDFYDNFYKEIFSVTGVPRSIMDLACGYNPFSIKYMNLEDNFKYFAYDINVETSEILNEFFRKNGYNAISSTMDLAVDVPEEEVDVTFIFKFLPLIEQQNKSFSTTFLKRLKSKYIVVSFPTKTVTGRNVGMLNNYRNMFEKVIGNDFELLRELVFDNEIIFIVKGNF